MLSVHRVPDLPPSPSQSSSPRRLHARRPSPRVSGWAPFRRQGGERVPKRCTGRDTELRKGSVEVTADGAGRQEQSYRDLLVRQARRREVHDLNFLGRKTDLDVVTRTRLGLSGCPELRARAVDPQLGPETLERFERGIELRSSV